jgi:hypothetical protein
MNNQPNQMPSPQIPDHRMDELNDRLRTLELQNTQLRTTIDMLKQPANPQAQPSQQLFKPEVQEAIAATVKSIVEPMQQQFRHQIGYMADQLDQTRFASQYGGDKYAKLVPKVEQLRAQEQAQGRYITREEALRIVHFDESGKKQLDPAPVTVAPVQVQPKFDPYLQTWVDEKGQPTQYVPPQEQPQVQPQQTQQFQQVGQFPAQPQTVQPQQVQQVQWQPGVKPPVATNHPNGNAYGQQFTLPGQGMNQATTTGQAPTMRGPLSLDSSESEMKAFETQFGDIPL